MNSKALCKWVQSLTNYVRDGNKGWFLACLTFNTRYQGIDALISAHPSQGMVLGKIHKQVSGALALRLSSSMWNSLNERCNGNKWVHASSSMCVSIWPPGMIEDLSFFSWNYFNHYSGIKWAVTWVFLLVRWWWWEKKVDHKCHLTEDHLYLVWIRTKKRPNLSTYEITFPGLPLSVTG